MLTYAEQALVMAEALEQYGTTEGVVSTLPLAVSLSLSRSLALALALALCRVSVCVEREGETERQRARARAEMHALCGSWTKAWEVLVTKAVLVQVPRGTFQEGDLADVETYAEFMDMGK
jgi:hypothetical protein